jgi:transposase
MARKRRRLSVRKIREILRLRFQLGLSDRKIARSLSVSPTTVGEILRRAREADISWPLPEEVDDEILQGAIYPERANSQRPFPEMSYLHRELARPRVTLRLLWEEYAKEHSQDHYSYSQFCWKYRNWAKGLEVALRQSYRAGERVFSDFSGDTLPIVDGQTGEVSQAEIFVSSLGYSNYTYAEACPSQELPSLVGAQARAFQYFGGVAEILTVDNLRQAVTKSCRYEPDLNPTFAEMAAHYGCAVIPARARRPRDKAKVEAAVLQVERWVLAPLRNHTFFSLAEANQAIRERLEVLNSRPMRGIDKSRKELFSQVERPALKPLPAAPYELAEWRTPRVNIDYHIEVDGHYYSVPYRLTKEQVEVRLTTSTVEVFFKGRRVASHPRSYRRGAATTLEEHRPASHRAHLEWTPSRIASWAAQTGPCTARLAEEIMRSKPHPEQGYRSCLGIIRLADRYSPERVEAAARRALASGAISYKSVKSILASGLDRLEGHPSGGELPRHPNLRGPEYFKGEEGPC